MDRSRPRGEADLGGYGFVRLQRSPVFSTRLRIKEKRTERRTRGPTFSCQSPSMTGLRVSHDPLQKVCSRYERVCQVNVFMRLLQSIFCHPLASLCKILERKQHWMHLKRWIRCGQEGFSSLKKRNLCVWAQENGFSPVIHMHKKTNLAFFGFVLIWKWILRYFCLLFFSHLKSNVLVWGLSLLLPFFLFHSFISFFLLGA